MNRELLIRAYEIIDGIPDARFNLDAIVNFGGGVHDCGTVACAMGWLGMHPDFKALGLRTKGGDLVTRSGLYESYQSAACRIFDMTFFDAVDIFAPRRPSEPRNHKKAFQKRVRKALKLHARAV